MLDNSFRTRYKTVPAAINMQNDFHMTLPHNHEEFEILIKEKGKCDIRIGDNVRECCAGDIVFVNPMEIIPLLRIIKMNTIINVYVLTFQ